MPPWAPGHDPKKKKKKKSGNCKGSRKNWLCGYDESIRKGYAKYLKCIRNEEGTKSKCKEDYYPIRLLSYKKKARKTKGKGNWLSKLSKEKRVLWGKYISSCKRKHGCNPKYWNSWR